MKKLINILLLGFLLLGLVSCTPADSNPFTPPDVIDEFGVYNHQDDVALYLKTYQKLPSNYLKKAEVTGHISDYWTPENLKSIGGDIFYNRERLLPHLETRTYYEADINYQGERNRNRERIVFSDDLLIFYTHDHYNTFIEYNLELELWILS